MFTYRIQWFDKQNYFQGLSLFSSWSYLNFLEMVWVALTKSDINSLFIKQEYVGVLICCLCHGRGAAMDY